MNLAMSVIRNIIASKDVRMDDSKLAHSYSDMWMDNHSNLKHLLDLGHKVICLSKDTGYYDSSSHLFAMWKVGDMYAVSDEVSRDWENTLKVLQEFCVKYLNPR